MLNDCYEYAAVVNAKGEPFPAEPLTMALLLLSQHKMIDRLTKQFSKYNHMIIIKKLSIPKKRNKN